MTQRVARPMKFAAFISIIISMAVIIGACQGAVGKAGDGGATGPSGPSGPPGRDGTNPLHLIGVTGTNMTAIATVNNGVNADTNAVTVGMPTTVDLATYHSEGQGTITYGKPTNADAEVFDAELTGSMLKLTPKEMQPGGLPFAIETFTVTIKDSDASGKVLTETSLAVRVRRNQKPSGAVAEIEAEVGSQAPATAPDPMPACTTDGVRPDCYVEVAFMDEDGTAGMEVLTFVATVADADADKVEVVSADADPADPLNARVVVRGLKTTLKKTEGADDMDAPVTVTITATDDGGLTAERTAEVSVDEAPRPEGTIPNRRMKQSAIAADRILVTDPSAFFEDPEAPAEAAGGGMQLHRNLEGRQSCECLHRRRQRGGRSERPRYHGDYRNSNRIRRSDADCHTDFHGDGSRVVRTCYRMGEGKLLPFLWL